MSAQALACGNAIEKLSNESIGLSFLVLQNNGYVGLSLAHTLMLTVSWRAGGGRESHNGGRGDRANPSPSLHSWASALPGRNTSHAHLQPTCENSSNL